MFKKRLINLCKLIIYLLLSRSLSHSIFTPQPKDGDKFGKELNLNSPSLASSSLFIVFENILTGFFEEQFRKISRSVSQDTFLSSISVHDLKIDVE